MIVLPTAYLGPTSYFEQINDGAQIEQYETFEKQTFRNRCLIKDPKGEVIRLTVPIGKAEHKQLTKDIEICYQSRWQHQHWIAIESAYRNTPYFDYYADYLQPYYEKEYKWLLDLNDSTTETILHLLHNEVPTQQKQQLIRTNDWCGMTWTDRHPWQTELSILDRLFELGPTTL